MKIELQQNKWHGDAPITITLPDNWEVIHETMLCDRQPAMTYDDIRKVIEQPVGMAPLKELAKGKKRVCIIFDDMSRPTPAQQLAQPVLDILLENGVNKENIIFICGTGNHGALTREDFVKKLGEEIVTDYFVYNHNPYDNLEKIGTTRNGIDVLVNQEVLQCDLKIGLGAMIPHAVNGFSGGYKIAFPGVAGIETMTAIHILGNHSMREHAKKPVKSKYLMGYLPEDGMRFAIEECGRMLGEFFKIDCFVNTKSEIVRAFAGDPVAEYYEAAKHCKQYYEIDKPEKVDVVIVNSNFKSNESNISYGVAQQCFMDQCNKNGDIVLINHAKSGQVPHYMIGHFGRTTKARLCGGIPKDPRINGKTIYYSPYGDKSGMDEIGIEADRYVWAKTWEEVMENLSKTCSATNGVTRALVIDEGSIISFRD